MHLVEIIHGDLTTSNIMLREAEIPSSLTKYEIVSTPSLSEEKADWGETGFNRFWVIDDFFYTGR